VLTGYDLVQATYAYDLYKKWSSTDPSSPFAGGRGLIVTLKHANPYYDDSYAVNSANLGPVEERHSTMKTKWAHGSQFP